MLTERLDEGLLVLRHLLHWQLIDLTYMTLNETKGGSRRWDGKPFVDIPHFDDLPKEVRGPGNRCFLGFGRDPVLTTRTGPVIRRWLKQKLSKRKTY